jgi:hypothetical protein
VRFANITSSEAKSTRKCDTGKVGGQTKIYLISGDKEERMACMIADNTVDMVIYSEVGFVRRDSENAE